MTPRKRRTIERHLAGLPKPHGPAFDRIIERVGKYTLTADPAVFRMLARAIVHQQISTKAANAIFGRLEAALGTMTHEAMAKASDDLLQSCGISAPKRRTFRDLFDHIAKDPDLLEGLAELPDEHVAERLLRVRGIGPWTVEMMQIFCLGRPDILPVGDLGLRMGVKQAFGLKELPKPKEVMAFAEPWRPHRTAATWYLWQSLKVVKPAD
jgi:3-methyladenine DNA glycosylase/8-oxoguanine DNA glycosylase